MSIRLPLAVGLVALAAWIAGLPVSAHAALLGWLVAFLAFSTVPIGCLAILMMVTLVPGTWRELYGRPLLLGSSLLALAFVAVLPILIGMGPLYPWTNPAVTAAYPPFKAQWLSPTFFVLRQILYWIGLIAIWLGLVVLASRRTAIAAAGLIGYALIASWMGGDLAESLTPDFHSSIYGLIILANGWLGGIAFANLVGLASREGAAPSSASGPFMVALLAWAYLHAMQFIVIWAGDIPDEVVWYLARGTGGWAWVTAALFLLQGFGPFFAMLSPAVRQSRNGMMTVAAVTLAMRPVEAAWLLLPGQRLNWPVWAFAALGLMAMAGLGAAALRGSLRFSGLPKQWRMAAGSDGESG
jgi:hypothetical protein